MSIQPATPIAHDMHAEINALAALICSLPFTDISSAQRSIRSLSLCVQRVEAMETHGIAIDPRKEAAHV